MRTNGFVWVVSLGLMVCCAGCVPSLYPLYTGPDVVFDPALIGEWKSDDLKETWVFTQLEEKNYRLALTDQDGNPGLFTAHLVKVEGRLFLDLFPEEPSEIKNDFYKGHLLPVHTFSLVKQVSPTLQVASMKPDELRDYLEDHPTDLAHERRDNTLILTAKPKDLQSFLLQHEKEIFSEPGEMKRK